MESALKADLSELRDRYRSSRDQQRTRTRVEQPRAVSDLTQVLVLVSQSLSPWKPLTTAPLAADHMTAADPWHEHLCLHRRSRPSTIPSGSEENELESLGPRSLDQTRPEPVSVQSGRSPGPGLNPDRGQRHFPFPNRRSQRISETARRLGLYSSA